jgi:hypothetical protein
VGVRVFLGGSELVGLRDPSYADPLIAVCQAAGLDFTFRPDLDCFFIASPAAGVLVALGVEEPSSGSLGRRLSGLLRGAGAQVMSEVGLIGRKYGDLALHLAVERGRRPVELCYFAGRPASRLLIRCLAGALDQAGLAVGPPVRGLELGLGRRVPGARVRLPEEASGVAVETYAQAILFGLTRFLWWRSLAHFDAWPPVRTTQHE